jgi:hypothetical protein
MQARAVPVRPRPPQQATSTRSVAARRQASRKASSASTSSAGRRRSRQRTHRESHATGRGRRPSRYSPKSGPGPGGTGAVPHPRRDSLLRRLKQIERYRLTQG